MFCLLRFLFVIDCCREFCLFGSNLCLFLWGEYGDRGGVWRGDNCGVFLGEDMGVLFLNLSFEVVGLFNFMSKLFGIFLIRIFLLVWFLFLVVLNDEIFLILDEDFEFCLFVSFVDVFFGSLMKYF